MAPGLADRTALLRILTSPWLAQCCYALAKLGVPDLLAGGPRPVEEIAAESGTHPGSLHRVLRVLAAEGMFTVDSGGRYGLGSGGELLRTGVPRSSRDLAVMLGEEVYRSFADITYTLQTGQPAFDKVYGLPFYDYLATSPQAAATFGTAMAGAAVPAALASCDLTGARLVVDVGGGDGALLTRVLRAQPQARGVLLELPQAIGGARERMARAGVGERAGFEAGSFFDTMPPGGDVYVLCRVLHNWPDADAVRLLRTIRSVMDPGGRLLVFEDLLGATAPVPDRGGVMDLLLLVMLSGSDRTEAQYRELLAESGFAVRDVKPPPLRARQPESVIEAVPS